MKKFIQSLFLLLSMSILLGGFLIGCSENASDPVEPAGFYQDSEDDSIAIRFKSCSCVEYARAATGIQIYGDGKDWDDNAAAYGYSISSTPVIGGAMNFEAGAHGANGTYGHVAKVVYAYEYTWNHWVVKVRHANWGGTDSHLGCNNVSYKIFTIVEGDNTVHFIY